MKKTLIHGFSFVLLGLLVASCGSKKEQSSTTGWNLNDQKWGGFEKVDYEGQSTGPNLVLVEGGTFTMGLTEQDVTYEWNNVARRVTVSSFYMDETEISNLEYREYLFWLQRVYGETYPEVPRRALPDTLVWREELSYNEPLVETYFRHPAFMDYPVVGVNWNQAVEYCKWRTDRVNEAILIKKGILNVNPDQKDADNFVTDAYLVGQYEGSVRKNLPDVRSGGERRVRLEDGIVLPEYRLPTEAEWEFAALSLIGTQAASKDELITDRRIYTWDGNTTRYQKRNKYQGKMLANFRRSSGDYGGMSGALNDKAFTPSPVRSNWPNDNGLYNMAGNVNEWTADMYRPMTSSDLREVETQDLNPYRGNKFMTKVIDPETNAPIEKDSLGRLVFQLVDTTSTALRDNYKRPEVYNYLDGDKESNVEYRYGLSTLISDKARVIKGGSWADRAFWLSPGTRRFLEEDKSASTLGFRCAMARLGGPVGNNDNAGNSFKTGKKKRRY
ncbi:MAG: SUMF1/EgtB/PvdO family nonheme iron enzyme [Chitinophagales bacterium]|jgi:gliding motility-associated lipoprotein GldJ